LTHKVFGLFLSLAPPPRESDTRHPLRPKSPRFRRSTQEAKTPFWARCKGSVPPDVLYLISIPHFHSSSWPRLPLDAGSSRIPIQYLHTSQLPLPVTALRSRPSFPLFLSRSISPPSPPSLCLAVQRTGTPRPMPTPACAFNIMVRGAHERDGGGGRGRERDGQKRGSISAASSLSPK
jgi:hypothetical protein